MPVQATILHADVDAFFASVEQRDDPSLRGKPIVVGMGVVMAASYEARAFGIRGGMGGGLARRLCPHVEAVRPRFEAYVEASKAVFAVFRETAPDVEGLSLEEAFLDVRGLERISGTPPEIAARLKRDVREQVGLTVTVGVARSKVIAKMASSAAKPDGLLVVEPGAELEFLHPQPVERIWGVGAATAERLHTRGIETIAQLAELSESEAVEILGRHAGRHFHAIATGRGSRRIRPNRRRRSIGSQSALGRVKRSPAELDRVLVAIVDRVTRRMRSGGHTGRSLTLRLRFDDYKRATRSRRLAEPTDATEPMLTAARELLAAALPTLERRGCTLLGITVSDLAGENPQLALPVTGDRRELDSTLDELADRYGPKAVTRAGQLNLRDETADDRSR